MDDNMKKAYKARHRQATLAAYELLRELWPPDNTEAYWERAAQRFADVYNDYRDNPMLRKLLVGVYDYLGDSTLYPDKAGDDAAHKAAFRVVLDLADLVAVNGSPAAELIDLAKGSNADNILCVRMLTSLTDYLTNEADQCRH